MMKVQLLFLFVFMGCVTAPLGVRAARVCGVRSCSVGAVHGESLELSCGIGGETVTSTEVMVGRAPSCEDSSSWKAADDDDDSNSCETAMKKLVQDACSGEESCSVKVPVADCPAGNNVSARIECGDPGLDALSILALAFVAFIALALGTTVTKEDFQRIWREKKRAFLIGVFGQFVFMPLFSFLCAVISQYNALIAIGIILCGSAPGGSTSNLYTYWAQGSVSLSIAMSAASTLCAFFMMPLNYLIYVQTGYAQEAGIVLPVVNVLSALLAIVIPVSMGMLLRAKNTVTRCNGLPIYKWVEKVGSAIGALFLVAAVITGVTGNPDIMDPTQYPGEWLLAAIFQPVGCIVGFTMARLGKLSLAESKAVSLEVGVQNYALVLAVCATSFRGCQQVQILTFPLLASLWYVISSALITIFMRVYCWERIEPADVMKAYDVEFSNNKDGGDNNNNNNNKN
eukprot:g2620.t1